MRDLWLSVSGHGVDRNLINHLFTYGEVVIYILFPSIFFSSSKVLSELAPFAALAEKLSKLAVQLVAVGSGVKSVKGDLCFCQRSR